MNVPGTASRHTAMRAGSGGLASGILEGVSEIRGDAGPVGEIVDVVHFDAGRRVLVHHPHLQAVGH